MTCLFENIQSIYLIEWIVFRQKNGERFLGLASLDPFWYLGSHRIDRVFGLFSWNSKLEGSSFSYFAFHFQFSIHQFNKLVCYAQSQPCPAVIAIDASTALCE